MEFLTERCYTALNADELKPGSKVICANNLDSLRRKVYEDCDITEVKEILNENYERRFQETIFNASWPLAYLVSEPEETWIVYFSRRKGVKPYLTACMSDRWESVKEEYGAKTKLFEGTEDECTKWYASRDHLTDEIAAWEDGKQIQWLRVNEWEDVKDNKPLWDPANVYRVKPEGLKWTDLMIGDVIQDKNHTESMMVIGIDYRKESKCHIYTAAIMLDDKDLENWEKVEYS